MDAEARAPKAATPKSASKAGANTPAPAAGGESVKPGENAPAVDGNGVRLPPKRSTGGRTKRAVAPVAAEQGDLETNAFVTPTAPAQVDSPAVDSEPSADAEVETAPLADAADDVDPEPAF